MQLMGAPSTYKQLLEAKQTIQKLLAEIQQLQMEMNLMKGFTLQQSLDMAQIALNREFHFGPKYNARFKDAMVRTFREFCLLCVNDAKDDLELAVTKTKVDRALQTACGDDIEPFEVRYDEKNLYLWLREEEVHAE